MSARRMRSKDIFFMAEKDGGNILNIQRNQ
jgi:hypothetical protein